jgi:hypothetical protein
VSKKQIRWNYVNNIEFFRLFIRNSL